MPARRKFPVSLVCFPRSRCQSKIPGAHHASFERKEMVSDRQGVYSAEKLNKRKWKKAL
jgi:hypothetical protein